MGTDCLQTLDCLRIVTTNLSVSIMIGNKIDCIDKSSALS